MLSRRTLLIGATAIGANVGFIRVCFPQGPQEVMVVWSISNAELQLIGDTIKYKGELQPVASAGADSRGLPLLYLLIGTIVLPHLAETLFVLYQRISGSGIVVQDSDKGLLISRDVLLPSDVMVIKGKNGIDVKTIRKIPDSSVILQALKFSPAK
jgi:hypothetical protein